MNDRQSFILTPIKFGVIIEYMASQTRSNMHLLMKKLYKGDKQVIDVNFLNSHQAFLTSEKPLVGSTYDKYEKMIFDLAEKAGVAAAKNDHAEMQKVVDIKKLTFPAHTCVGLNMTEHVEKWISNLLIIYNEVHRTPKDTDDMTHEEYKEYMEEKKKEKAHRGRETISNSTSGLKRQVETCI